MTITNRRCPPNSATDVGGGIVNVSGGTLNARSAIIAQNTATTSGPDVFGTHTLHLTGHDLVAQSDGSTGFTIGSDGDLVGTGVAPINPLLGPSANNGGPTQTMALLPGSPTANAGDDCRSG